MLARLVFDGALNKGEVPDIWHDLAALGLTLHPFDLIHDGPEVAAVTARLRRRHATDSTYVCLARRLGTVTWTFDGALARNAADLKLPVRLLNRDVNRAGCVLNRTCPVVRAAPATA